MEIWRDVPGWESRYQASTLGNIKSLNYLRKGVERILKPGTDGRYNIAFFSKNGKRYHYKWHLVIANTFPELIQGEWFPGAEIDHINGIKTDNRPENLRWVDHTSNMNNVNTKNTNKKKKRTVIMSDDEQELCYFFSVYGASKDIGVSRTSIIHCCEGVRKTAAGYYWRYA